MCLLTSVIKSLCMCMYHFNTFTSVLLACLATSPFIMAYPLVPDTTSLNVHYYSARTDTSASDAHVMHLHYRLQRLLKPH